MGRARSAGVRGPRGLGGFTLVEMVVVLALIALVSGLVAVSVRPSPQQQLHREGERLALWLESIRQQSRGQGHGVQVRVDASGAQIWMGSRAGGAIDRLNWLDTHTTPVTAVTLTLGPEPMLPPQQVQLTHKVDGHALVRVGTRGLGPWTVQ